MPIGFTSNLPSFGSSLELDDDDKSSDFTLSPESELEVDDDNSGVFTLSPESDSDKPFPPLLFFSPSSDSSSSNPKMSNNSSIFSPILISLEEVYTGFSPWISGTWFSSIFFSDIAVICPNSMSSNSLPLHNLLISLGENLLLLISWVMRTNVSIYTGIVFK